MAMCLVITFFKMYNATTRAVYWKITNEEKGRVLLNSYTNNACLTISIMYGNHIRASRKQTQRYFIYICINKCVGIYAYIYSKQQKHMYITKTKETRTGTEWTKYFRWYWTIFNVGDCKAVTCTASRRRACVRARSKFPFPEYKP